MWEGLSTVPVNATLIHLGDVVLRPRQYVWDTLERLPGSERILIEGNHDKRCKKIRQWEGWNKVVRYGKVLEFERNGIKVAVTHRPQDFPEDIEADILIHGHIHERGQLITRDGDRMILNLCVEQTGYYPVSWEEIKEWYENDVYLP